ncbi:MAG: MATE family efflux transporter, partial [Lachnospiraceae bacterium]|nr:MATE family efflux transporter [Lachnospiraceae bacterium]
VSLARQLFVLLPSALILAVIFRENGGLPQLWYSFVIAEVVALILTFFFYRRVYSQKVAPLPE